MNPSLLREMWRTAASLELLPVQTKTQLGDALIARIAEGRSSSIRALWCLSRLGARKLFYGPINQVLPASTVSRWVEALLKIQKAEDAVVALARRTGDSTRDLAGGDAGCGAAGVPGSRFWMRAEERFGGYGQDLRRRTAVGPCVS